MRRRHGFGSQTRAAHFERGESLVLVLAVVTIMFAILAVYLGFATTSVRSSQAFERNTTIRIAADSALDAAVAMLQADATLGLAAETGPTSTSSSSTTSTSTSSPTSTSVTSTLPTSTDPTPEPSDPSVPTPDPNTSSTSAPPVSTSPATTSLPVGSIPTPSGACLLKIPFPVTAQGKVTEGSYLEVTCRATPGRASGTLDLNGAQQARDVVFEVSCLAQTAGRDGQRMTDCSGGPVKTLLASARVRFEPIEGFEPAARRAIVPKIVTWKVNG